MRKKAFKGQRIRPRVEEIKKPGLKADGKVRLRKSKTRKKAFKGQRIRTRAEEIKKPGLKSGEEFRLRRKQDAKKSLQRPANQAACGRN